MPAQEEAAIRPAQASPCDQALRPADAVTALEDLARELTARGWVARLRLPAGRAASLFVQNPDPEAAALHDHILAAPDADGVLRYWWAWGERIGPAGAGRDPAFPARAGAKAAAVQRTP